jgi:hypothetical protein
MRSETSKTITYDPHISSYQSFFDHAWASRISSLAAASPLDEPVMSLVMNWKSAANTQLMPWLMITNLTSFAKGYVRGSESPSERNLPRITAHILDAMGDSLSNMKRQKLREVMVGLAGRLQASRERYDEDVDPQELFEQYVNGPGGHEFKLSLWVHSESYTGRFTTPTNPSSYAVSA